MATCPREPEVQQAAMSGRWPAALDMHARECASCRDLRRVVEVLQSPVPPAAPAVDASALWACGRHARRIAVEARISTIVAVGQIAALVCVLGVLVAFVRPRDLWETLTRLALLDVQMSMMVLTGGLVVAVVGVAWWVSTAMRSRLANARGRSPA